MKAASIVLGGMIALLWSEQPRAQEIQIKLLQEIRKTCSGVIEINTKNGTGIVAYKDFQLTVQAGKEIEIHHEGVLITKVQSYTAVDYNTCLKDLAGIFSGRSEAKPFNASELFSKLRFGDYGQTSFDYVKSLLGTPIFESARRAHFERDGFAIDVKFLDKQSVEGPKGLLVAAKVTHLKSKQFSVIAPELLRGRLDDKAVYNASNLNDFGLQWCSVDYYGGAGDKSERVYFCSSDGDHSQGFIKITLYLDEEPLSETDRETLRKCIGLQNYNEKLSAEKEAKNGEPPLNWHSFDAPFDAADAASDERDLGLDKKKTEQEKNSVLQEQIENLTAKMRVFGLHVSYASYIGDLDTTDDDDEMKNEVHPPPPKGYR